MRYLRAALVGFSASFFAGFAAVCFGGGGIPVFLYSAIPAIVVCVCLATAAPRLRHRPVLHHIVALLTAYFTGVFIFAVIAPAVEVSQHGIDRVNVAGYIGWSWIYAAVFLLLSYPTTYAASDIPRQTQ